jgi:hypothetical protein
LSVLVAGFCLATEAPATVYYVDADSPNDGPGNDWAHAYHFLQDALTAAGNGDEIRVAEGTYRPDETTANPTGTGDRTATFQLETGLAIFGGYRGCVAGDCNSGDLRDVAAYPTILSGDLAENDGPDFANYDENSNHVVTGSGTDQTALIDGFVITAGNASTGAYFPGGAGMHNVSGSPTVSYCTFTANTTYQYGAGMLNYDNSSPIVTHCYFTGNKANDGGGMLNTGDCSPTIRDCLFIANTCISNGGGMHNGINSNPIVDNCTFSGNSAGNNPGRGGGMYNSGSSPTVTNCTFSANSANSGGGGMHNIYSSSPTVVNCIFAENVGGNGGGGGGGGMWNGFDSSPSIINCIFVGNESFDISGGGGGIRNEVRSSPNVTNCTFSANSATVGAGMRSNNDCTPTVVNSIFWGNLPDQINDIISSSTTVDYSDIQGGWTGAGGAGNINLDPRFIDPDGPDDIPGNEDDNLRLLTGSPCIDAGDNSVVTEQTDLDGNPRIVDGDGDCIAVVDMGAYEYQPEDCNANGSHDLCDIAEGTSQDCNMNGVPDECESLVGCQDDWDCDGVLDMDDVCLCTPCFAAVDAEGRPEGDIDKDCDVDLNDFARFASNFGATDCQ